MHEKEANLSRRASAFTNWSDCQHKQAQTFKSFSQTQNILTHDFLKKYFYVFFFFQEDFFLFLLNVCHSVDC